MSLRFHIVFAATFLLLVFVAFVGMYEFYNDRRFSEILGDHARVIGEDLWTRHRSGPVEYVTLAARLGKYRKLQVFEFENDVFLEVDGPEPEALDRVLFDLGLIPVEIGQTSIFYNEEVIGRLVVERYRDSIYVYAYSFALTVTLLAAYLFFIRTAQAKQELESRVLKRTAELRQLRNNLSDIINSMPSVLIGIDRDGRVTQWNSEAERITGLAPRQARGQAFEAVFPQFAEHVEQVQEALRLQQVLSVHRSSRSENGETRYEDIAVFPLLADGVEGAVIRLDDVTDRVRIEEIMIQSEKMLSVGGLAAGMAHEINNPLGGMIMTARALSDRIGANKDIPANHAAAQQAGTSMQAISEFMQARDIPQMLNAIVDSGHRIAGIVSNMLDFSRKSDAGLGRHDLTDLLEQTLELAATDFDLKKHYDFRGIEISRDYAPDLKPVPCEGSKIQQVLLNILRNGAQAMSASSTENPRFNLKTWMDAGRDMACLEISDNGSGMDPVTQKRVFEPFFTTKSVGEGTGLGLAICYFIITEHHDGELEVDSIPGVGSTFLIRLPCQTPETRPASPAEPAG